MLARRRYDLAVRHGTVADWLAAHRELRRAMQQALYPSRPFR